MPTILTCRSCIGPEYFVGGKAGGTVQTTYTVLVVGAGTANVTAAIYDFSGASHHYNSDFGALSINVVSSSDPVAIDDSFTTSEDTTLTIDVLGVVSNDIGTGISVADRCPVVAGVEANQGCPDLDGDGAVDRLDRCPTEKGAPDNAGCPQSQLVKVGDDKLEIIESVYFKLDRAVIEERSFALLDNVAAAITSHANLTIQVEGHIDDQGNDAYNLDLSQRRAQAVVDYLVTKGVAAVRLQPRGFGETKPIADNQSRDGRAQNRRVVFTIIGASDIQNK